MAWGKMVAPYNVYVIGFYEAYHDISNVFISNVNECGPNCQIQQRVMQHHLCLLWVMFLAFTKHYRTILSKRSKSAQANRLVADVIAI